MEANVLNLPRPFTKFNRFEGKTSSTIRSLSSVGLGTDISVIGAAISSPRVGEIFVVDQLVISGGNSQNTQGNESLQLRITNGTTNIDMFFMCPSTTAVNTNIRTIYKPRGVFILPEGYWFKAAVSNIVAGGATPDFTASISITGYWLNVEYARDMQLPAAFGDYFIASVKPAGASGTLVPAIAGKSIQILGWYASGIGSGGAATLRLQFSDGTNLWPFKGWQFSQTNSQFQLQEGTSNVNICGPLGHSVAYAAGAGAQTRSAVTVFGRYVDNPNTYDPKGKCGQNPTPTGTATAGGASTLTDAGKAFTTNYYATYTLRIIEGTGAGQARIIASNTATAFTTTVAWTVVPDTTSKYLVDLGYSGGERFWAFNNSITAGIPIFPTGGTEVAIIEGYSSSAISTGTTDQNGILVGATYAVGPLFPGTVGSDFHMTIEDLGTPTIDALVGFTVFGAASTTCDQTAWGKRKPLTAVSLSLAALSTRFMASGPG